MSLQSLMSILEGTYSNKEQRQAVSWWIVESVMQKTKLQLITTAIALSQEQYDTCTALAKKHAQQYPLQYILKTMNFCGTRITVEPPTLIPRPETEEWVQALIELCAPLAQKELTILDMCTGSGCIGIALAKALPCATVLGVDIQTTALTLTQKNIADNNLTTITCIASDLYTNIPKDLQFDLIVTNPPYITEAEFLELEPVVTQWEDKKALVADDEGLELIKKIINDANRYLKKDSLLVNHRVPRLIIEIGHMQGVAVKKLCTESGFDTVTIVQDLYGKDRTVQCL